MKTVLVLMFLASPVLADEICSPGATCTTVLSPPTDAPVRDLDAPGRALVLDQGEFAPYRGVLLDEQEAVRRERARVRAEVALETAQRGVLLPRAALIGIIAGCVAVSAAAAAGVTAWALKR